MSTKPFLPTPTELIHATRQPDLVEVPARQVLVLDGEGGPDEPVFTESIGVLYGIAYGLRSARKNAGLPVFKVGVLEGEWRAEGVDLPIHQVPSKDTWRWRLQLCVPSDVTSEAVEAVVEAATTRRGGKLEGSGLAKSVRLRTIGASRYARILHIGPYAREPESMARIDAFLTDQGLTREPWHVEVYLSAPDRTAEEKLETVLLTKVY